MELTNQNRFEPAVVDESETLFESSLYGLRREHSLRIGGRLHSFRFESSGLQPSDLGWVRLSSASHGSLWIGTSDEPFLTEMKSLIGDASLAQLPESLSLAILETWFEDDLCLLSNWLGETVNMTDFRWQCPSAFARQFWISVNSESEEQSEPGHFRICLAIESGWQPVVEKWARMGQLQPTLDLQQLSAQLPIYAGSALLTTEDFDALGERDLVMVADSELIECGIVSVSIPGSRTACCRVDEDEEQLEIVDLREYSTSQSSDSTQDLFHVSDVPLRFEFVCGEIGLPLKKIGDLSPGDRLKVLSGTQRSAAMKLHGQPVAVGALLRCGRELGFRVKQVLCRERKALKEVSG